MKDNPPFAAPSAPLAPPAPPDLMDEVPFEGGILSNRPPNAYQWYPIFDVFPTELLINLVAVSLTSRT